MRKIIHLSILFISSLTICSIPLRAQTPVELSNPGFEEEISEGWGLWIAPESTDSDCHSELSSENPHSGKACLKLSSESYSRFSIGRKETFPVQTGERYRISFWLRGNAEFAPSNPGFLIRVLLSPVVSGVNGSDTELLHINLNGEINLHTPPSSGPDIPPKWTQVSSVFEIPDGAIKMTVAIFMWKAKGEVFIDDFAIEKVGSETPLSKIAN